MTIKRKEEKKDTNPYLPVAVWSEWWWIKKQKENALVQDRTGDLRIAVLLTGASYESDMRPTS